jgi:hypothetical protein
VYNNYPCFISTSKEITSIFIDKENRKKGEGERREKGEGERMEKGEGRRVREMRLLPTSSSVVCTAITLVSFLRSVLIDRRGREGREARSEKRSENKEDRSEVAWCPTVKMRKVVTLLFLYFFLFFFPLMTLPFSFPLDAAIIRRKHLIPSDLRS